MSIGGVLGTVARAHKLVVGGGPWDDATQVSADCKVSDGEEVRELSISGRKWDFVFPQKSRF